MVLTRGQNICLNLMRGHNICFNGEICLIISKLFILSPLILSTGYSVGLTGVTTKSGKHASFVFAGYDLLINLFFLIFRVHSCQSFSLFFVPAAHFVPQFCTDQVSVLSYQSSR